jgi:tetratricopeptide (TPR) repeat protein
VSHSPLDPTDRTQIGLYREATDRWSRLIRAGSSHSGNERNCAFINTATGKFADISAVSGLDWIDDARAVASVDWDQDGDLDLWISNRTAPQLRFMRNDLETKADSLSLHLVGQRANRDAIGARVELTLRGHTQPLVRWVSAGSGFLSQESRWVHFGLKENAEIERLVVHWPGGQQQQLRGVESGGRYEIVESRTESAARVRRVEPRHRLELKPTSAVKLPLSPAETLRLASRPASPILDYEDWAGHVRRAETELRKPLLLNLWASWCAPCVEELTELGARREQLEQSGVEILALSVDGLGDDRSAEPGALKAFLDGIHFPFKSGLATAELVDKLELLYTNLFGRHMSFPVPVSFLIDGEGRLANIYLGKVEVDELLNDIETLEVGAEELRMRATPFRGRWISPIVEMEQGQLAREYLRAGYAADAEPLLRAEMTMGKVAETPQLLATALSLLGLRSEAEHFYREAIRLDPAGARAHYNLALLLAGLDRAEEAASEFEATLEIEPAHLQARYELAGELIRLGRAADAIAHYRVALQLKPGWGLAGNALARQLAASVDLDQRDIPAAIELAEQLCRATQFQAPELLDTLAISYAAGGRLDEAVAVATRALQLAAEAGRDRLAEELAARVDLFRRGGSWTESVGQRASSP